jgi:hypothetical protein
LLFVVLSEEFETALIITASPNKTNTTPKTINLELLAFLLDG